ncbi:helix-turn-helix domain-containing protein [Microbacterium sp. GbtcB4]|uniref:helix-turn-helix transcriptional regulator n=1 Tax=Microbacterium sp. GbtcB4 TaxID=2824749 RepID=UPI001C2F6840
MTTESTEAASGEEIAATSAETRAEMTRLAARGYTQLRHVLVQLPDAKKPRASTAARALSARKHRALLLYILLLTCWPWLKKRTYPLEADVWVRALESKTGHTWSTSTLSRAWADLVEMGLVTKEREGRLVRVTPRREDGAAEYAEPGGRTDRWNTYFVLPDEFWNEEWFAKLSMPALVMFLVIAKETNNKDEVWLNYDRADEWYGIKAKSAQNGLTELVALGLAHRRTERIKAKLSPTGETVRMWYSLTGVFGHTSRAALQTRAKKATRKRHAAASKKVSGGGSAAP